MGSGKWEVGSGKLALGSWQLAVGSWQLAVGSWQLNTENENKKSAKQFFAFHGLRNMMGKTVAHLCVKIICFLHTGFL